MTDKDAAVYTRRLALEEGMFLGNSAGAAIKGVLQLKEHFNENYLESSKYPNATFVGKVIENVDFSKADINSDGKFTVADIKILTKQCL